VTSTTVLRFWLAPGAVSGLCWLGRFDPRRKRVSGPVDVVVPDRENLLSAIGADEHRAAGDDRAAFSLWMQALSPPANRHLVLLLEMSKSLL
jgi:hypothetical protein